MTNIYQAINFDQKFSFLNEQWAPRIIGEFQNFYLKAAKIKGEVDWHVHEDVDETIIINSGELRIFFRDGEVVIGAGECFIVPKGLEHKAIAEEEVAIIFTEKKPDGGDLINEEWI